MISIVLDSARYDVNGKLLTHELTCRGRGKQGIVCCSSRRNDDSDISHKRSCTVYTGRPFQRSATRHILSTDLPGVGDLEKRFIFERVIVEVISKKTYAFRECFQVLTGDSILFLRRTLSSPRVRTSVQIPPHLNQSPKKSGVLLQ